MPYRGGNPRTDTIHPMGGTGIVTDSVSCVTAAEAETLDIEVVRTHLYLDGVEVDDAEDLYPRLAAGSEVTTSSPSPGEYLEAYRRLAQGGKTAALVAPVSARLSASFDAARLAADGAPIPVTVIDTKAAAWSQGLLVTHLARHAAEGASPEELANLAERIRPDIHLMAALSDLEHLIRTGRIANLVGRVGSALDVTLLLELRPDGEIKLASINRSVTSAYARMVSRLPSDPEGWEVRILHAAAPEEAGRLAHLVSRRWGTPPPPVIEFPPLIAANTGPGLVGIGWGPAPR